MRRESWTMTGILRSWGRRRGWIACGLLVLLCSTTWGVDVEKPGPWSPQGIKPFEFTDQFEKKVTNETLKGKPWIVGFIFTRCAGPCPTVTRKMKEVRDQTGVKTVSVTVDPDFDTPELLGRYAKNFVGLKEDDPDPWLFLNGPKDEVYPLIKYSFLLPVEEMEGENRRPGWEVLHSTEILLVNGENQVVAKFNAQKDEEVAKLRRILQGKDPFPPAPSGVPEDPANTIKLEDGNVLRIVRDQDAGEETAEKENQAEGANVGEANSGTAGPPEWALKLPALNATLNAVAAVLLVIGYVLIKGGYRNAHKNVMLAAFGMSVLFLGSYLVYHSYVTSKRFEGPLGLKLVYYPILVSHVLLAMGVPFLAGATIWRGLKGDWVRHKRIAKVTYPIWIYVSVTGVIIYLMLYQLPKP